MDYFCLAKTEDKEQAKWVLNRVDVRSGPVFSAIVTQGGDECALAVVTESLKFRGRSRISIAHDQEFHQ